MQQTVKGNTKIIFGELPMIEKAFVVSIEGQTATVMPLEKDECQTCNAECSKKANLFTVKNTKDLPIKLGSIVKLESPKKIQYAQGIASLLFPIICAVAGFLLAPTVCALFGKTAGEGSKVLGVLIPFVLSSALIFVISRKHPTAGIPLISEIL